MKDYGRSEDVEFTSQRSRQKAKRYTEESSDDYVYTTQLNNLNSMVVKSGDTSHKRGTLCEGIFEDLCKIVVIVQKWLEGW